MNHFCAVNNFSLITLIEEAFLPTKKEAPPGLLLDLQAIGGLQCIISYFCAPDGKFEPKEWTLLMVTFEIAPLNARLLFVVLNRWRSKAIALPAVGVTIDASPAALSSVTTADIPRPEGIILTYDCSADAALVFTNSTSGV